ncbi:MAG TPA: peptidylprolyl isomerase [Planctomycetaceae bacterium]|nr:peptidylprolyl isomerase [Planctomycetaceae bacterium]
MLQSVAATGERIDPKQARQRIEAALQQLREGKPFEDVVKKFSDASTAKEGGWQMPANPDSIVDEKTAEALRQLAEGATSPVIETDHSLRLVRVISRVPASCEPFEEVEKSIRERITQELQQRVWQQVAAQALIESAYRPSGVDKAAGAFFWEQAPPELPKWDDGDHASGNGR